MTSEIRFSDPMAEHEWWMAQIAWVMTQGLRGVEWFEEEMLIQPVYGPMERMLRAVAVDAEKGTVTLEEVE